MIEDAFNTGENQPGTRTTNPPEDGKTFTQEEVDRIVQERLARERKKNQVQEPNPLEDRERDLARREAALGARELLTAEGYPVKLAEVIDYKDMDDFKAKYEALKEFLPDPNAPQIVLTRSTNGGGYSIGGNTESAEERAIREAMRLD